MSSQKAGPADARPAAADAGQLEARVRARLVGRVRNFRLSWRGDGLVLQGQAPTYYAKQLAQHAVLESTSIRITAKEIEVRGPRPPRPAAAGRG